jgi:two-component SAPR family response regulator
MPRLNGVELASRINDIDKNIKLILMSAFEQTDIPLTLPHEFVQKPIHMEKLTENSPLYRDYKQNKYNSDGLV